MKKVSRKMAKSVSIAKPKSVRAMAKKQGVVGSVVACIGSIGKYLVATPKKYLKFLNN